MKEQEKQLNEVETKERTEAKTNSLVVKRRNFGVWFVIWLWHLKPAE